MRKLGLSALMVVTCTAIFAQTTQKLFSYEQLFRGAATNVSKTLPSVMGWADDDHYLVFQKDSTDGKNKTFSVDVKTGKSAVHIATVETPTTTGNAPSIKDARNLSYSPDKQWIAYTKPDNNLYLWNVSGNKEMAVTKDGSETILNGYASWVYYEEILGRGSRYKAFWWSPDSKKLCFMRFDDAQVPVFPIYWSDGQHGRLENERYPKPGDKNPEVQIGVVAMEQPAAITWADFNAKEDQYFGAPIWTPGSELWVQWMNRDQNQLIVYQIAANGGKMEVYKEEQKTWIDLDEANRIEFLADGKSFLLKSDKDGWENLYLHAIDGKQLVQLTTGNFWGTSIVKVDAKSKQLFFKARKENSARFDFYRVGLDGKGLTRLSFGDYSHDQINLSPSGKYFITSYSNVSTPTTMALVDAKGKVIRELGTSKGTDFDQYSVARTEIVRVKSADGLFELPVLITYPTNFDPTKKYPILVSIYGGPNAGTVYDRWRPAGGASQWWAQEGLIQVAFDNRASGHFGKIGLNYIHRQLGKFEIEDFMACGNWLKQQSWVDGNRLCITGGSFGGYMTCMALTYGADVFSHGIANASVTDWQLYDTHYTERFMDQPKDNPEGYKITAVNTYAHQLKGNLKIVHGTSDDNVHMQNSIQFINKLEELRKHFEFMLYPGERHGIGGNSPNKSQHLRMETYNYYYQNLLQKPMPAALATGGMGGGRN